jgi:iron only hydrogenase large subunit-like protein/uncharacterized Fe-S cluster-containing protein
MVLIKTNEAKCRDCYRCVRTCPVKAIRIKTEREEKVHAQVLDDFCLLDGKCILSCPQKAKKVVSDISQVKYLLEHGIPLAASVAPSFAASLPLENPQIFPTLLKKLGFKLVQETAVGAEIVAREYRGKEWDKPIIDSSCPVIVNLVEKHYPNLIPFLSNTVSPMIAHGRYIKANNNNLPVVFIGPCIAKKGEAMNHGLKDAVDFVLGFDEVWEWIIGSEINLDTNLDTIEETYFDEPLANLARLFPVEGGILQTSFPGITRFDVQVTSVTGLENCKSFLEYLEKGETKTLPQLTELLACNGGCIGGPRTVTQNDIFLKRQKVIEYYNSNRRRSHKEKAKGMEDITLPPSMLRRKFLNRLLEYPAPSEKQIKEILAQTGKYRPEDELNCGACGYNSCRDKAIAVYQGTAEVQMCIPYMRKRAESMSNIVLNSMPNGILIVDDKLTILEINPKAEEMFQCNADKVTGQKLDCLIDPGNFQRALEEQQLLNILSSYSNYGITTREIIFPLKSEQIIVGIFVDISAEQRHKEQLDQMKSQTIERAQEVIEKQMKVAQEIAGLLGETTAETKVLLTRLIQLMEEPPAPDERGPENQ